MRGLAGARDEFILAAIAQNLKTLANQTWRPPRPHVRWAASAHPQAKQAAPSENKPMRTRRSDAGQATLSAAIKPEGPTPLTFMLTRIVCPNCRHVGATAALLPPVLTLSPCGHDELIRRPARGCREIYCQQAHGIGLGERQVMHFFRPGAMCSTVRNIRTSDIWGRALDNLLARAAYFTPLRETTPMKTRALVSKLPARLSFVPGTPDC